MARTLPTIATEVPGGFVLSSLWNAQVGATMQWFFGSGANNGVPRFFGTASTGQAFASTQSFSSINIDSQVYDSEGGHSTTTNPSRYTVQVPGMYRLVGQSSFGINSSGARAVAVAVNGSQVQQIQAAPPPANTWAAQVSTERYLNVGDYVEVRTWQNSGSALTTGSSGLAPSLSVWWIGNN